jgi:transposase
VREGVVDLVTMKAIFSTGEAGRDMQVREIPAELQEQAEEYQERLLIGDLLLWEAELANPDKHTEAFAKLADQWKRMIDQADAREDSAQRRIARRVSRGLAMAVGARTKDPEYLAFFAKYRPARGVR